MADSTASRQHAGLGIAGTSYSWAATTWPGGSAVTTADASNVFGTNLSGLSFQTTPSATSTPAPPTPPAATRVATISSGFSAVMELEFDAATGHLWAVCDNTGKHALRAGTLNC